MTDTQQNQQQQPYLLQPQPKSFDPAEVMIQLKNKGRDGSEVLTDYLPVQYRLVWFNEVCPHGCITIVDKLIDLDREIEKLVWKKNPTTHKSEQVQEKKKGYAWFHVRVEDGKGRVGEAIKTETAADFPDFAEKANTGALGRALAMVGFGTQHVGREFDEGQRIVDAPVEPPSPTTIEQSSTSASSSTPATNQTTTVSKEKQPTPIRPAGTTPLSEDEWATLTLLRSYYTDAEWKKQLAAAHLSSAIQTQEAFDTLLSSPFSWTAKTLADYKSYPPIIGATTIGAFKAEKYGERKVTEDTLGHVFQFLEDLHEALPYFLLATTAQGDSLFKQLRETNTEGDNIYALAGEREEITPLHFFLDYEEEASSMADFRATYLKFLFEHHQKELVPAAFAKEIEALRTRKAA